MKKVFVAVLFCTGLFAAEFQSAKVLQTISQKATEKVIADFKENPTTKAAYDETKDHIIKRLTDVASGGFYDIAIVNINNIHDGVKHMKYNKLSDKEKDMLKSILTKELKANGYRVEPAQYNNIGLHWAISWQ